MSTPLRELALLAFVCLTGCHTDLPNDGDALDAGPAARTDLPTMPDTAMERLPWDKDLSLVVRGLGSSEGKNAWLRIHYTVTPTKTPWRPVSIRNGVVMMF